MKTLKLLIKTSFFKKRSAANPEKKKTAGPVRHTVTGDGRSSAQHHISSIVYDNKWHSCPLKVNLFWCLFWYQVWFLNVY